MASLPGANKNTLRIYTPGEDDNYKYAAAQYLGSTDSLAIFEIIKKEGMLSGKLESWLLGVFLHNGKKAFEFETNSKYKYAFFPINVSKLEGANIFALAGPYFDADARVLKDRSCGMGI